MVLRKLENKELSKENGVYTIKTEATFSDCIVGDGIILALSKERQQIIKYSDDLDIISVESIDYMDSVSVKEYQFKDIIFLDFFFDEWRHKLMMLTKGEAEWIEWQLKDRNKRVSGIDNIYHVDKNKYIVDIEVQDDYFETYWEIIAEIDLNSKQANQLFEVRSRKDYFRTYNQEKCPRFMFYYRDYHTTNGKDMDGIFDLYTGFCYKLPERYTSEEEISIEYSSKEIIVLKIKEKYYVYINGYLVYQYTVEKHKAVLYNLKNKREEYLFKPTANSQNQSEIKLFYVPLGKKLCSWIEGGEPILKNLMS